jgi:hypothetical protein
MMVSRITYDKERRYCQHLSIDGLHVRDLCDRQD